MKNLNIPQSLCFTLMSVLVYLRGRQFVLCFHYSALICTFYLIPFIFGPLYPTDSCALVCQANAFWWVPHTIQSNKKKQQQFCVFLDQSTLSEFMIFVLDHICVKYLSK